MHCNQATIFQTNEARKEFLCSGPGGLAGKKTMAEHKHTAQDVNREMTGEAKENTDYAYESVRVCMLDNSEVG